MGESELSPGSGSECTGKPRYRHSDIVIQSAQSRNVLLKGHWDEKNTFTLVLLTDDDDVQRIQKYHITTPVTLVDHRKGCRACLFSKEHKVT